MRNLVKKAAVTALVCVTAAGMMAGCGNKKLDGTKIAVTVNKQEIPFGVVSLAARMQQAQAEAMYKMYLGGGSDMSIWSTKMDDDSDETYGENAVTTSVETVEKMCLEKEHASEYDVEITDDEQKALEEAAKNFMAANSDETIAELAVDEDMVKTFLELETYDVKMKDAIEAKADVKLDEKEYQQMSFSYASAKVSGDDLSDDDIKGKVLHRRIEYFLDHPVQAVYLVNEKYVVFLQVGQQRGQVPRLPYRRPGGYAHVGSHLVCNDLHRPGIEHIGKSCVLYCEDLLFNLHG